MKFFTSDQHYCDTDIMEFVGRPYRTSDEMDEDMISKFVERTKPGDEIYMLGDIFGSRPPRDPLGTLRDLMRRLGAGDRTFHLMRGNHDHLTEADYKSVGFASVMNKFDFITIGPYRAMISHDPCMIQPRQTLALHGHIHSLYDHNWNEDRGTLAINFSVEVTGYAPVSEEEVLALVASTPYAPPAE